MMSFKLWMEVSSGNILLTQLLATLIKSYYKLPLQYMPRTRPLNNFKHIIPNVKTTVILHYTQKSPPTFPTQDSHPRILTAQPYFAG